MITDEQGMQPLDALSQPKHADPQQQQQQPAELSPNPGLARPSNEIPRNEKFTLPRNAEEHGMESKIPNRDRKTELATQTERAAGRRKMQPGPGEAPPGDDPQRDRRNDTPAYTAEGNPTPKTLSEAVLQTKRASERRQRAHRGQRRGAAPLATRGAARVGGVFLRRRWRRAANAVWGGEARGGVGRKGGEVGGNNGAERKDARRRGGFEF